MLSSFLAQRPFSSSSLTKKTLAALVQQESLQGKQVLVRADLNVPLRKDDPSEITDDTRIREAVPSLKLLLDEGAKVVLCSHLGRPKGKVNDAMRLTPVASRLSTLLNRPVPKSDDCIGEDVEKQVAGLQNGSILLLENVRFHSEEEKNEQSFAEKLALKSDYFVNDAFGTAHRAHASTEGVTNYIPTSVAGHLLEKELVYLDGAVNNPERPLTAVIGGAKIGTKIPVLESLIQKCDKILIGGGMIFTFYKAQGLNVGSSIVEDDKIELAKSILDKAKQQGVELVLPTDVVIANEFAATADSRVVKVNEIPEGWMGLDIGPESVSEFSSALRSSKTIVWNGPMGVFEFDKFAKATMDLAQVMAECTEQGSTTIIGGGDSVAAVHKSGLADKMSHISTGGGASLEMLEGKILPGVAALTDA